YTTRFRSENDGLIPFADGYAGNVYHRHVHTHIAYHGCKFPVDPYGAASIAERAAESIGVSYGKRGNLCLAARLSCAAVADRFSGAYSSYLSDDSLQTGDGLEIKTRSGRVYSIKADAQSYHIIVQVPVS